MAVRARRSFVVLALVLGVASTGAPAARAASPPSVRLFGSRDRVTVRERTRGVAIDLGVWIASVGGDFEIRLSRPDYRTPVEANQTTTFGSVVRSIPTEYLDGWNGLDRFLHVSIKDAKGRAVYRDVQTLCPNGWEQDRLDDSGPIDPSYPRFCGGNPFTRGVVWGIDRGWAVNPLQWLWLPGRILPAGRYDVRVWIDGVYTDLLQIPAEDAEVRVPLVVEPRSRAAARPARVRPTDARPLAAVPEITPPSYAVPDLAALPAWGISTMRRDGRDHLVFGATVWNAGPSPMTVEGYRRADQDVMDAWQYFTDSSGHVIGKAQAGEMEYDARPGHEHWHFDQFATYALTDATKTDVVRSEKVSFCLAPTDAIDLLVKGAEWSPYQTGLSSACGEPGSLWVRETLPVGWGDTYVQWLPGQSFDVTDLPNGRYFIRVQVNPLGALVDGTSDDDVSFRRVRLRGRRGDRWVVVPPYETVDTEACPGCFPADGQPTPDGAFRARTA
jgi:lysyl oxidase